MSIPRLDILAILIGAYWQLGRALRALWMPALMALALFIAAQFSAIVGARFLGQGYLGKLLIKLAIEFGSVTLIAPFLIATHRFIQIGETEHSFELTTGGARQRTFTLWLIGLAFIAAIPSLVDIFIRATGSTYYAGRPVPLTSQFTRLMLIAMVTAIFVAVTRLMIVLPAVAVDARDAGLDDVFQKTRGHVARIAVTAVLSLMPLVAVYVILFLIVQATLPNRINMLVAIIILKMLIFAALTVAAAVASQTYLTCCTQKRV